MSFPVSAFSRKDTRGQNISVQQDRDDDGRREGGFEKVRGYRRAYESENQSAYIKADEQKRACKGKYSFYFIHMDRSFL